MKIIGFSKIDGVVKMVLKGDSSLLVNRKPFFIPDWSADIRMRPCVVLRVSRLGKNIAARFATRYYDAAALGLNIWAADFLLKGDYARAWAFDYSMVVGNFVDLSSWQEMATIIPFDEAISRASAVMTLRQGDMIFVDCATAERALVPEEVITVNNGDEELLFCKIK